VLNQQTLAFTAHSTTEQHLLSRVNATSWHPAGLRVPAKARGSPATRCSRFTHPNSEPPEPAQSTAKSQQSQAVAR
jgi:hypothetical protein